MNYNLTLEVLKEWAWHHHWVIASLTDEEIMLKRYDRHGVDRFICILPNDYEPWHQQIKAWNRILITTNQVLHNE